jgi:ATP-dependent DNA ligase
LRLECFAIGGLHSTASLGHVENVALIYGLALSDWCDIESMAKSTLEATLRAPLPTDVEGYVFKDGNLTGWAKWKPTRTADLVVTGLTPGRGKYAGLIGSLECSLWGGPVVADVSGFTDAERAALGPHVIGQVVEVAYQYVGARGRLRHPRFVRWRDDKAPEECRTL